MEDEKIIINKKEKNSDTIKFEHILTASEIRLNQLFLIDRNGIDYHNFFPKYGYRIRVINNQGNIFSSSVLAKQYINCDFNFLFKSDKFQPGDLISIKYDPHETIENKKNIIHIGIIKKNPSQIDKTEIESNGDWFNEILKIIYHFDGEIFTIDQIYAFEEDLKSKFPNNPFIKEKIIQQLQSIRDHGIIEFLGDESYKKTHFKNVTFEKSNESKEATDIIYLQKTDKVARYGNDLLEINKGYIINCKKFKITHPDPEVQRVIDSIAARTDYQITEENESKINKDDETETSSEKIPKVDTFVQSLKRNIKGYSGHFADIIKYTPDFYELFESLLKEKKFNNEIRTLFNLVVAYFVLPDDVVPEDEFGPFGYIDDLYLCVYVLDKLNTEKETINKYWKGTGDVFDLAAYIKKEIENAPTELIGKEKLESVICYIEPGRRIYISSEPQSKPNQEKLDETSIKKPILEKKDTGKTIIPYDPTRHYVRESDNFLELIHKKTDFTHLTLDKKYYILQPEHSNNSAEIKINNSSNLSENTFEKIQNENNNNQIVTKIKKDEITLYASKEKVEQMNVRGIIRYIYYPFNKHQPIKVKLVNDVNIYTTFNRDIVHNFSEGDNVIIHYHVTKEIFNNIDSISFVEDS
jgi:uncharacterized membrane protein YkvA (DUF1232 family)